MPVSSLLINFLLLLGISFYLQKFQILKRVIPSFLKLVLSLGFVWLIGTALGYLLTPLFFDHAEASIAAVAALWLKGGQIYTDLADVSRHSLLYGPWPYLVAAFFQKLGDAPLILSKVPGVLNLVLLLTAYIFLGKALKATKLQIFLSVALISTILLGFYQFSYWNRPDSYLMAYVSLGLLVITVDSVSPWFAYLGIGVLAGLASNSKLHGVLYFTPLVIHFLEAKKNQWSFVKLFSAAFVFILALISPFLLANVGAENYMSWLKMASKHGIVIKDLIKNITFISCFILPLVFFGFHRKYKFTFGALIFAGLLVAVAASKPGAGPHHFIPFIPVIVWWAVREYLLLPQSQQQKLSIVWVAFVLTISLNAVNRQKRIVALFSQTKQRVSEFADLQKINKEIPEGSLELGISDNPQYESTFYKAFLVSQGRGLLFDGAALMDMKASGMDVPETTLSALKTCQVPYFVMPKEGVPWSILNFYGDTPLFTQDLQNAFAAHYEKQRETDFFAVYKCKTP